MIYKYVSGQQQFDRSNEYLSKLQQYHICYLSIFDFRYPFIYIDFSLRQFYNMKQQNNRLIVKPTKSLSARTFLKSARKKSPTPSQRFKTLNTQPIDNETYAPTKRQLGLQFKSSRQLYEPKRQTLFSKPTEALHEQTQMLKIKVNKLEDDLLKQRSKHQQDMKGLNKMQRQFDIEFEKEKYYESSYRGQSNIVEGVKYQYQKNKKKLDDKCREYDQLLQRFQVSAGQEHRFYSQALELDNKKINQRLQTLLKTEEDLFGQYQQHQMREIAQNGNSKATNQWRQSQKQRIAQLLGLSSTIILFQQKVKNAQERYAKLKQKMKGLKCVLQQRNKKIVFLQKLLTQKSNQIHSAILKERKVTNELKCQIENVKKLQLKIQVQQDRYKSGIQILKQKQNLKFQTQKIIFINSIKEKDQQIQKLTHQVQYLSTIISYIKTGEDPFKIETVPSYLSKKNSFPDNSKELLINIEKSLTSFEDAGKIGSTRKRVKTLFQSNIKDNGASRELQPNTQNLKQIRVISDDQLEGQSQNGSINGSSKSKQLFLQSKMIKKSYFKHNSEAFRVRFIKPSQIDHLKKILIYRFIFYRLQIDQVKQYLSFNPTKEQQSNITRKQKRWKTIYIDMKEIKDKLQCYPFELGLEDAQLLARYIVQDVGKEDVWCHEENQIQRTIAKSIVRAFVGEYQLPNVEQARKELKEMLSRKGKHLKSTLTSLASTGQISSVKFIQICQSIQFDLYEDTRNWILSQLFSKSINGLSNLQYQHLFNNL